MNIILSIHPKWAKLIYECKKTIEWRKSQPLKSELYSKFESQETDKVFIYETFPIRKITGFAEISKYTDFDAASCYKYHYEDGDEECKTLIKRGCVSIENLAKYQGCSDELIGWEIKRVVKLGTPKPLEDFGLKRPPQSWCYTEVEV